MSVLTQTGMALLGFNIGQSIDGQAPKGKTLKLTLHKSVVIGHDCRLKGTYPMSLNT